MDSELEPADAPMAKMLSVVLIIGQIVLGLSVIFFLIAAVLFSLPETTSLSIRSEMTEKLNAPLILGDFISGGIVALGWFFVLHFLRKATSALIHGDPFLPENISRLRFILLLIIATEVIRILKVYFLGSAGEVGEVKHVLDINIGTWFFIFIIATISEAFRHGAALRAEQELTI